MTADAPCRCLPWPVDPECCPDWPGDDAPQADKDRAARAVRIASDRLRRLTAGRWGLCEEVLRPCNQPCGPGTGSDPWDRWPLQSPYAGGVLDPYVWGGKMFNRACGCAEDCACGSVCKLALPGPVDSVVAVKIDGDLVDPATYFVNAAGELVRRGAGLCWPDCQDMTQPDTEPGTFSVRYLRGRNPEDDPDALRAVSVLACELFKNLCGRKCALPGRVRSVQREGVTYEILTDWPRQGTGLDSVDDWLGLVNPYGHRSVPTVTTPDLPTHRFYNGPDCR
ncbi:hypothetical protein [Streptomyces sp. NPDC049879]|uniref:hypothetical protein n=1 Tax=Streptomyces sp. NPDC049879 TaxID=3365598 RepID=UPI00379D780A